MRKIITIAILLVTIGSANGWESKGYIDPTNVATPTENVVKPLVQQKEKFNKYVKPINSKMRLKMNSLDIKVRRLYQKRPQEMTRLYYKAVILKNRVDKDSDKYLLLDVITNRLDRLINGN